MNTIGDFRGYGEFLDNVLITVECWITCPDDEGMQEVINLLMQWGKDVGAFRERSYGESKLEPRHAHQILLEQSSKVRGYVSLGIRCSTTLGEYRNYYIQKGSWCFRGENIEEDAA